MNAGHPARRRGAEVAPTAAACSAVDEPGDAGVATVWAAAAIGVLMVVLVGGLHLGGAIVARHRAESAADLAALAGAQRSAEGATVACASAAAVAAAAGSSLFACRLVGWDVLVDVQVSVPIPLPGAYRATGRARAGPVTDPAADPLSVPPDGAARRDGLAVAPTKAIAARAAWRRGGPRSPPR